MRIAKEIGQASSNADNEKKETKKKLKLKLCRGSATFGGLDRAPRYPH
jgi:hypothetical protein